MQAIFVWSMKTRRAPSQQYRDARVYDHTTTVMRDNEYIPSAPHHPLQRLIRPLTATVFPSVMMDPSRTPSTKADLLRIQRDVINITATFQQNKMKICNARKRRRAGRPEGSQAGDDDQGEGAGTTMGTLTFVLRQKR